MGIFKAYRKKRIALILVLGVALTGMLCRARVRWPSQEAFRLDVMTCNIGDINGTRRMSRAALLRYLSSRGMPDVLMLQELTGQSEAHELATALGLPHYGFLGDHGGDGMGIGIFSRFVLTDIGKLSFADSNRGAGAIRATIVKDGHSVTLVNTHLDRISGVGIKNGLAVVDMNALADLIREEFLGDTERTRMVGELIAWLDKKRPEHLILGGDFNTIPLSKAIRLLTKTVNDVLWPSLDYFKGTYTKLDFPVAPRIDYLFVSPDLVPDRREIISQSPGDHLPVRATIRIPVRG